MSKRKFHWVSGSGMVGCLYDGGPDQHASKREAIANLAWHFQDLSATALRRMRSDLHRTGIHYFSGYMRCMDGGTVPVRVEAGADYCEITRFDGPMDESGEES